MKRLFFIILFGMIVFSTISAEGAQESSISNTSREDSRVVANQQGIYADVHPIPTYDYSIPRDILTQIIDIVTTRAYVTYTVVSSITGNVEYHGRSIGYAIPADTSLTNPYTYVVARDAYNDPPVQVGQPEPNGLFQSRNTDGTWVLFLNGDGSVSPIYTEMKVTTYPFEMMRAADGTWVRVDDSVPEFTVDIDMSR